MIKKEIYSTIKESLKVASFSATRTKGVFVQKRRLGGDGWLGLNENDSYMPHCLFINPVIGVRHDRVQGAWAELGANPGILKSPTLFTPLGYLMPESEYREWRFSQGEDHRSTGQEIASAVIKYGGPFIEQWGDWENFSEGINETDLLLDVDRFIIIPIVRALNGETSDAKEMVDQEVTRLDSAHPDDMHAQNYRIFAKEFKARFFA